MSDDALKETLIDLLAGIGFAERYYALCVAHPAIKGSPGLRLEDDEAALKETHLPFKYRAKERFFRYTEKLVGGEIWLNVAFPGPVLELILELRSPAGRAGSTFARLARWVAQAADPSFDPDPPSPMPGFRDADELREVVKEGMALFLDVRRVVASHGAWGA